MTDAIQMRYRCFVANKRLPKKLAKFMQEKRGDLTFEQFSEKLGISSTSLHRIERCKQNVTLETLQKICDRLKCKTADIFKD